MNLFTKNFRSLSLVTTIALFTSILSALLVVPASAASLTDVSVALDDDVAGNQALITITFTPVTAITTGSILEVTYDTGFTGVLLDADVAVTGTNITSTVESDFATGYFKSTLTTSGSVTTEVTITIADTKLTNPAAGNYSFSVTADIGGLGTTYDNGAGLAYIADDNDVTVTAYVPPVLDMEIYQQNSATMTNTCALGVLSINQVKSCVYDIAGATNNSAGLTIKVMGVDTTDWSTGESFLEHSGGVYNIDATGASTAVVAGTEGYGFQITDDGSTNQYDGSGGTFETANQPVPSSETTFAITSAVIDGINTQADRLEVTHYAAMSTDTVVGDYTHGVVYTAYTN